MKSVYCHFIFFLVVILGLWGCRTSDELISGEPADTDISKGVSSQVNYTAIYVIHGDANYLYHDQEGNPRQADEEKVKEAKSVARQAEQGEVFIFYQRPEQKILWLFPRKDRVLLHYRNGKLVHHKRYSPASSGKSLAAESELFRKYRAANTSRKFFLYFGHEIPHLQERSYHRSRPGAEFNIEHFVTGMRSFLDANARFDLTVLSTCDNGTPAAASQLQPVSRYLLASPQNLHLSHIDTHPLLTLEDSPQLDISSLADLLARQTYDRLSEFIETAITLSIYNLEKLDDSLNQLSDKYLQYHRSKSEISFEQENSDCTSLPFWDDLGSLSEGTTAFYRPPNFGSKADHKTHSGWGCQN